MNSTVTATENGFHFENSMHKVTRCSKSHKNNNCCSNDAKSQDLKDNPAKPRQQQDKGAVQRDQHIKQSTAPALLCPSCSDISDQEQQFLHWIPFNTLFSVTFWPDLLKMWLSPQCPWKWDSKSLQDTYPMDPLVLLACTQAGAEPSELFARTQDTMMQSFSRPWNASTVSTSPGLLKKHNWAAW